MAGIYYQNIEITDFGPYITKLVIPMPRTVSAAEITPEQWNVYVEIFDKKGYPVLLPKDFLHRNELYPSRNYRPVAQAYPCDLEGNRLEKGDCVALEMPIGPFFPGSSGLAADFSNIAGHERYTVCCYRITQLAPIGQDKERLTGLVFDTCAGVRNHAIEGFRHSVSSHPTIPLRYGYFVPELRQDKHPLIVWLHGAGEGGDDTAISYSGNKVTAIAGEEIQKKFGGAFIFSPQCPTMWLDDGSGTYGETGKSIYVEALKYAIDEFIEKNQGAIDTRRIYIGGDSNGGFMTMRMIIDYPDFFAAAFPICEALLDSTISDQDIQSIRNLPIWFTHAKNDTIVPPERYVLPTWKRLKAAGAEKLVFTFWDGIEDMHSTFPTPDGKPFVYMGHIAWIPVLNNDCKVDFDGQPVIVNGKELTLFDWIALQRRED